MTLRLRKYLAEAIGTYLLVFCGTGAIAVDALFPGTLGNGTIALTFGLIVMVVVYSIGELSGAHINPAVSIGFWASGRFSGRHVIPYICSQSLGAILASLTIAFLLKTPALGVTSPAPVLNLAQTFALEVLFTYVLMFVIINVATGSKEVGIIAGIAIGGAVGLNALFGGPLTGASMNPARSLAPALVAAELAHLWIYLLAPVMGSIFAVYSWKIIKAK